MNDKNIPTIEFQESEAPICEINKLGTMRPCTAVASANITVSNSKGFALTINVCQKHLTRVQDALKPQPKEEEQ